MYHSVFFPGPFNFKSALMVSCKFKIEKAIRLEAFTTFRPMNFQKKLERSVYLHLIISIKDIRHTIRYNMLQAEYHSYGYNHT